MRSLILLAAIVATATAQESPRQTFKSGVQLVEVDVRVFDREGRFVRNLSVEDFELLEEGAPQKIEALYFVEPTAAAAPGAVPDLTPSRDPRPASAAPAPVAPQTWIFFFDLNHLTPGGGFDRARKAVEDFIRDGFREGDVAGILAGDKMVNNRLTSVRQDLLEAVTQVKPRADSRNRFIELTRESPRFLNEEEAIRVARNEREWLARVVQRACSEDPQMCPYIEPVVMQKATRFRTEIHQASMSTFTALNGLASGLARIPGPKTVVLLSDGFVIQDIETTLRSVVGQIARAGARVYAIDVRGLDRAGQRNLIDQPVVDDSAGPFIRSDTVADGPNSVAVDTGGMMIRNENNIGRALGQIAEDAGRYYVLAYQPANSNFDGKYRPIEVRVKREGVRVRARRGYLALAPARMTVPKPLPAPERKDNEPGAALKESGAGAPPAPAPAPIEPVSALPSTGKIVAESDAAAAGGIRLRPDIEGRVNALSERAPDATLDDLEKRGWEAYQRGDIESAASLLSRAAAKPGAGIWVHYALGMAQAGLNRPDDAIRSWEVVRKSVPDFEPVYMDLADTYAAKSDLTTALAIVRDAEKRWPNSPDVQSAIGVIHVRRGAIDDGIEALEKVVKLTPEDPLAHLNLARAYTLQYHRGRRYVASQRRWFANEGDREKALAAYAACIKLGGPYAQQAKSELGLLQWSK